MDPQIRTVKKFLFLPKTIGTETRWLTTESWEEVRCFILPSPTLLNPFAIGSGKWSNWKSTKFI